MEIFQVTGHPKLLSFDTLTNSRKIDSIATIFSARAVDAGEWISLDQVLVTDEIQMKPNTFPS